MLCVSLQDCDALWEDFHNKLVDSTLLKMDEYLLNFPDLKVMSHLRESSLGQQFEFETKTLTLQTRVAKRSRKLIDYDSARHHVETLQMSGMKNDRKVMKVSRTPPNANDGKYGKRHTRLACAQADEELRKAQRVFDELNVSLQNELPTLWERYNRHTHTNTHSFYLSQ